jgi:hypothetical protein
MGLAPTVIALGPGPAVPRALAAATARLAALASLGAADGAAPATVLLLAKGAESMIWTKLKAVSLSALTAAVLVAGAVGLNGQQNSGPAPKTPPSGDHVYRLETGQFYVNFIGGQDPAEQIAKLAQEAQRQAAAGDAEGALRTMRQLDEASWAWQGRLREQRAAAAPRHADPSAAGGDYHARPGWASQERRNTMTPAGGSDLEGRMREVEKKLDRLLKALDGPKGADAAPKGR